MTECRVIGLRSIELDVFDLDKSADFYRRVWGLEEVARGRGSIYLRGTGAEHHILTLHEQSRAALHAVNFAAQDRRAVDALHAKVLGLGIDVAGAPDALPGEAGGGYGFSVMTPEGQRLVISCDVAGHAVTFTDRSKPAKLSHVVLNVEDIDRQRHFFIDALGFQLTDSTKIMDFVRCSSDHHSIALARGHGAGLNHMAYEVPNFDGLMRGAGRLKGNGYNVEWGIGRHGPGANIFSYYVEPNGFVTEYTAEVEQIDEATHIPQNPEFWAGVMKGNPDRWGYAWPSDRLMRAMHGKIVDENNRQGDTAVPARLVG